MTHITPAEWHYEKDSYGDWRGYSADGTHRTRLKASLDWAQRDVASGRLQVRRGNAWIDAIDGPRNRYAMPVENEQ